MSLIQLAELLDQLNDSGKSFIYESSSALTISKLDYANTIDILENCNLLQWNFKIFDGAGTEVDKTEIYKEFFPFRIELEKKFEERPNELNLLTNTGFSYWLEEGHSAQIWRIARLDTDIVTKGRVFSNWNKGCDFVPSEKTKSPRVLVRDLNVNRFVCEDIQIWLLRNKDIKYSNNVALNVWLKHCYKALIYIVANEIDPIDAKLKFYGPPRLSIAVSDECCRCDNQASFEIFINLQSALLWVFDNEKEVELKHGLLVADIAQSISIHNDDINTLLSNLNSSLDGAKIAYQASLSELGKDTLKILSDLKKTINEEMGKVNDVSRQLTGSLAAALVFGVGLIAARVSEKVDDLILFCLMLVILCYVFIVMYSGVRFVKFQHELRKNWQFRLYRFLPKDEYEKLIVTPTQKVEKDFYLIVFLGVLVVIGLLFVALCISNKDERGGINDVEPRNIEKNVPPKNKSDLIKSDVFRAVYETKYF